MAGPRPSEEAKIPDDIFRVAPVARTERIAVSVIAPCYNEATSLAALHQRTTAACRAAVGDAYELVLVDDGSRDDSWPAIVALAASDRHVVGLRLARNHGHQLAVTAGLALTRGERVLIIDADLQDPPELLVEMMRKMDEGADVVYGRRATRTSESWFKRATAAGFYRLLRRITDVDIPVDTGDFRLMNRRVVEALQAMPERHRFIRGMVSWVGGRQVPLDYDRAERFAGSSKYPLSKMIRFALDAITGFSIAPLRVASHIGLLTAPLAIILLAYSVLSWMSGAAVAGWTSLIAAVVLFGSIQLFVLGIIGEYLGRLLVESKRRPLFLIESVATRNGSRTLPIEFASLPRPTQRELTATLLATAVEVPAHSPLSRS